NVEHPRTPNLEECSLIFVSSGNTVTMSTARLIALASPHHDRRAVPGRRFVVHESLVARRGTAADHADRLELVHDFGDAHERRHRPEGQSAKVNVGAGEDHADALIGETIGEIDDAVVE